MVGGGYVRRWGSLGVGCGGYSAFWVWVALVVEMWAEKGIDCCEHVVSVDEEGLQGVR